MQCTGRKPSRVTIAQCCLSSLLSQAKRQAFRCACRTGRLRIAKQLHMAGASGMDFLDLHLALLPDLPAIKDAEKSGIDAAVISETLQESSDFRGLP